MTSFGFKDNVSKEIKPTDDGYELWVYLDRVVYTETEPFNDEIVNVDICYEHSLKHFAECSSYYYLSRWCSC